MSKLRLIVSWSGGKDSHATLLHTVNKYGADRVEALFCDTGWEHPLTYTHVQDVCDKLGIPLITIKSKRYKNFQDMCIKAGMFPTAHWRFCTAHLKVDPMVDWILGQDDNLIIFQGIRAGESATRAKMDQECMYFKEYYDEDKAKAKLYRKKAVKEWCSTHDASVMRPVFKWTGQQVIDYILENGHQPNPLYRRGTSRVGCFPCVMARLRETKIVAQDPAMRQRLLDLEKAVSETTTRDDSKKVGRQFFTKGYIPEKYCREYGNGCPSAREVMNYVTRDDAQLDMFEEEEGYSCMSLYHGLCE